MRSRTLAILAIVFLTGLAAGTLVSAETPLLQQRASGYAGGFSNWAISGDGYGPGYCAAYADQELTVKTIDEALVIAKEKGIVN